uniref:Uncharacterized protein n=1 Tax=Timema genevievae TaxID=629358 RepID=A0A7R9PMT5_TIMGE|nr:unnamed protein product [Timema genevievae]
MNSRKLRALSLSLRVRTISPVALSFSRQVTCLASPFICSWLPRQYASRIRPKRTDTDDTCISDLKQRLTLRPASSGLQNFGQIDPHKHSPKVPGLFPLEAWATSGVVLLPRRPELQNKYHNHWSEMGRDYGIVVPKHVSEN